ncbi:MAG: hypothetical protein A4S09_15075 [Proteobacteria bacterium SG_bin7]|nr:MAG: hypothetical protein A4S09_15075 [Proteobacteria bacterium SG_bin7]
MQTTILFSIIGLLYLNSAAFAKLDMAPPNFTINKGQGNAVFVDFTSADYEITYDVKKATTTVISKIHFTNEERGFPIFDLVEKPMRVVIDGKSTDSQIIEAPRSGEDELIEFRIVSEPIDPGNHLLVIEHQIKSTQYSKGGVNSGFFMSDIGSRALLERYLPCNFEYDQLSMRFMIKVIGATEEEVIFTNGKLKQEGNNLWSIAFPNYFNQSSVYFHIREKAGTDILHFEHRSIDDRNMPITIYKTSRGDMEEYKNLTVKTLSKFENLFGAFPHPTLTIYIGGNGGGMEYSGATVTDAWALPHELAHSFFGRGVMPANGNAGWIDEAMATLVGGPYAADPNDIRAMNMSNHSVYYRDNDSNGYTYGMNFLAFLGIQFSKKNNALNMNGFLKTWMEIADHHVTTVQMLQNNLENYSQLDLNSLFQKYVFGKSKIINKFNLPNPHMKIDDETLTQIQ